MTSPREQEELREIWQKLSEHPISNIFQFPIQLYDTFQGRSVKKPVDLQRIKKNIDSGKYTKLDFRRDLEQLLTNCTLHFSKSTYMIAAAEELYRIFDKICPLDWAKKANDAKAKVGHLLLARPYLHAGTWHLPELENGEVPDVLTRHELTAFMNAKEILSGAKAQAKVLEIIRAREPDLVNDTTNSVTLNLLELKTSTTRALIDYAKQLCAEKGKKFN